MKLVWGDKVIENAKLNVGESRLCKHDMEGRIKYWVEIVIPASEQHGGYAVRQLFGQDPNIGAREVVLFEVGLTASQAEQIRKITEADLLAIRNGNNPTTIYSVNLYEDVPKGSPSVLKPESAVQTVKTSGEYLGYLGHAQWFQHNMPEVIVRRDSHDRATYFERDLPPAEDVLWDYHYSQYVETGYWKEITEQEAMRRIEANRKVPQRGLECENPDCRLKGKIEDLDSPFVSIPCRGCDSKAVVEFVYPSGFRIGDRVRLKHAPRIYNRDQGLRAGQTGRVLEPPNPDTWPADAVQITIDGGQGAVEADCLEKNCGDEIRLEHLPADRNAVVAMKQFMAPADRIAVIAMKRLMATKTEQAVEYPVEAIDCPRAGIDQVLLTGGGGHWNEVCEDHVWNAKTWATRRHNFKIRCLPQHLPPVANAAASSGVDLASGPDTTVQTEFRILPLTMTLCKTLSPGVWAVCPTAEQKPTVLFITQETTLDTDIPAVLLTTQTCFKTPANVRQPVMPKDFGKVIWWHDAEDSLVGNIPKHRSGKLIGQTGNILMIEGDSGRTMHVYASKALIVDPQTEGF